MSYTFPTLSTKQDQRFFSDGREDNTQETKSEDGYVFSRPRTTRRPRRIFTTGYTNITDADKAAVQAFWDSVQGRSEAFIWVHPTTGENINVRFAMKQLSFDYAGWRADSHRWDLSEIKLKEV